MNRFLDQAGLEHFWAKIVAKIEGASVTLPKNLVKYSAVQSISATEILNATTLGGYSASYFAKAADVTNLSSSVENADTEISSVKISVLSIANRVSDNEDYIGALITKTDTNTTKIGTLESSVSGLQSSVASISATLSDVSSVPTLVEELSTQVEANTSSLGAIVEEINTNLIAKDGGTMTGPLVAKGDSATPVAQVRNVIFSTADPTESDGSDGDIWIKYGS